MSQSLSYIHGVSSHASDKRLCPESRGPKVQHLVTSDQKVCRISVLVSQEKASQSSFGKSIDHSCATAQSPLSSFLIACAQGRGLKLVKAPFRLICGIANCFLCGLCPCSVPGPVSSARRQGPH